MLLKSLSLLGFVLLTSTTLVLHPTCLASDAIAEKPSHSTNRIDTQTPVELPSSQLPTPIFTPSTQTHYDETVTIQAPPPEEEAPQAIPVKRFQWLHIQTAPLNPTQQNR